MHFVGDRARMGTRTRLGGPQAGIGKFLRHVFQDRQRLPHPHIAIDEHRHLAGARQRADTLLEIDGIE